MNNIKFLRKGKNITLKDLAKILNCSESCISLYENGKREPDFETLQKIADYFNVSVDYILGRESDDERIKKIGGFNLPPQHSIKIYGEVVCGKPVEAWQTDEGYVSIDYPNPEEYFGLRVKGDSMINVGIRPNSILIVHKQEWAENGDIVVACINGESTTKRYKKQGDIIFLMPENSRYEPIIVTEKDVFRIFGKVVECKVRF